MAAKNHHLIGKKHTRSTNIIGALVVRENDLTMVTLPNGNIPVGHNYGYGVYYNDCRFLSGYVLKINGRHMTEILSSDQVNYGSTTFLTNPDFTDRNGNFVNKETISLSRNVVIPGKVVETITIDNFNIFAVALDLTIELDADFDDIFTIRGITKNSDGLQRSDQFDGQSLLLSCKGKDRHTRITLITFRPAPGSYEEGKCTFSFDLEARGSCEIAVEITVDDVPPAGKPRQPESAGVAATTDMINRSYLEEIERTRNFHTSNSLFNRVLQRSMLDLRMMHMTKRGHTFFSAGVPWYDALFGRDSIITALQVLPYHPGIARETLKLHALYQGTKHDEWTDEAPGKILHELRVGEKANLREIPETPYYGSVDSTPLYLVLLADYVAWTGDLGLFGELSGHADAALAWIDGADLAGNGFVSYATRSLAGLYNQGWKDSWDAVMHADGSLARHPVAMAEVQGYAYAAKTGMAALYETAGRADDARRLRREAGELKKRFNEAFWMDDHGYFAMAIDARGRCEVISSNPARCLWSGIVDDRYARQIAARMFEPDMFTGWGIRTLSSQEVRYNPLGYHIGTVWPHDNALIASGLCKYGLFDRFSQLFTAMYEAASVYTMFRLPELFGGFDRGRHNVPIKYPVACSPQAWSSGTLPFMLASALGFRPDAANSRLTLIDPYLPPWLELVRIRNLRVGSSLIDLEFERRASGTLVDVQEKRGDIRVMVEY